MLILRRYLNQALFIIHLVTADVESEAVQIRTLQQSSVRKCMKYYSVCCKS